MPAVLMNDGKTLAASGVNAVWIGERGITGDRIERVRSQGARIFAEFNTLHRSEYLKKHPEAAPVQPDGTRAPAPHGWQGICPTHRAYRAWRMAAFRKLLADHALDGVWLDYHHAHASWERAKPALPDTCFCPTCLAQFQRATGIRTDDAPVAEVSSRLLGRQRAAWTRWRCGVFTDWVRAFCLIRDEVRPKALLGTFHCPWTEAEHDGALKTKLAIDLVAQRAYIDVFSPMTYHARFGHGSNPAWIARQIAWLGNRLGIRGELNEGTRIWPIVQLRDWGDSVAASDVPTVIEMGTRRPATGVMVFSWGGIRKDPEKTAALVASYKALAR